MKLELKFYWVLKVHVALLLLFREDGKSAGDLSWTE